MQTINKLVLLKEEYDLLKRHIHSRVNRNETEARNADQLIAELNECRVLDRVAEIPSDVIRLNSIVEIDERISGRTLKFRLVLPAQANLSRERISILSPMGIAVMGYRKGQEINWEMPSGNKIFFVKEVVNI